MIDPQLLFTVGCGALALLVLRRTLDRLTRSLGEVVSLRLDLLESRPRRAEDRLDWLVGPGEPDGEIDLVDPVAYLNPDKKADRPEEA